MAGLKNMFVTKDTLAGTIFQHSYDPLGLFEGPPKPPSPPAIEPVPVMPTPDDEAAKRARAKSVARQRTRGGRASTIFTSGLGG